ncbi:MAG: SURF1 family protein [Burkholderiales bacterium]|nr:SURF1 family protein [Burkholderiales bacterium]
MPDSRLRRAVPTLAAVAGVVITAYLGNWQLERAAYKSALQARIDHAARAPAVRISSRPIDGEPLYYSRVTATGHFVAAATILLDNRVLDGVVGYEVLTPLRLEDSMLHVLVNRGWVKATSSREHLPDVPTPQGVVTVEGLALPPRARYVELGEEAITGPVWQNLKFDQYAQRFGLALQPLLLQQGNEMRDGLSRSWMRPDAGVDRHRAYALQWFVMSGVIAMLYVVLHVRRKKI